MGAQPASPALGEPRIGEFVRAYLSYPYIAEFTYPWLQFGYTGLLSLVYIAETVVSAGQRGKALLQSTGIKAEGITRSVSASHTAVGS